MNTIKRIARTLYRTGESLSMSRYVSMRLLAVLPWLLGMELAARVGEDAGYPFLR